MGYGRMANGKGRPLSILIAVLAIAGAAVYSWQIGDDMPGLMRIEDGDH
jgi:hypothetical protein